MCSPAYRLPSYSLACVVYAEIDKEWRMLCPLITKFHNIYAGARLSMR